MIKLSSICSVWRRVAGPATCGPLLILSGLSRGVAAESNYVPYACVPAATTLVLNYFGKPAMYATVVRKFSFDEKGNASIGEMVGFFEQSGLRCRVFRGLRVDEVRSFCAKGCAVVVTYDIHSIQHADTLLGSEGQVYATDLQTQLHPVRVEFLQRVLAAGGVCVIVSDRGEDVRGSHAVSLRVLVWGTIIVVAALAATLRR